ncbi:MAG: Hsp70 family protein [Labilithrix sp.]|nr:Hsp70 family protein [Labilithrix sp.]MBX3222342.1 Hsp70 family protein [Labilithrix sp.]
MDARPEAADAPRFVVGIDLGTTHTVVAYAPIDPRRTRTAPEPTVFPIPQLTTLRESEPLLLLSSCLYAPLAGELAGDPDWIAGEAARRRGAEVTGRFVSSAKSWLSHAAVDRTAAILPWGVAEETSETGGRVAKLSPVDASTRLLAHIVREWDREHPDAPLAKQDVILTLPASFDDVARELTVAAANGAGLAPTLLEEPTAAFYDAMRDVDAIREHVVPRSPEEEKTVLVCDVGGGTTDLSLMAIAYAPKDKGGFTVRRVAVGRHILLGGDNMDLALAHLAEGRITGSGARLEPGELAQLVLACREAKERILSSKGSRVAEARVTLLGRGSKLVGGARGTTLSRDEVEDIVLRGFFPADVEPEATARPRGGIVAFGLPYERDPAVTRHIRQFLARHASELPAGAPDVVLLNGGVFNAAPIVKALKAALKAWAGKAPEMLPLSDPDLAVACGAVRYGFARKGIGVRVESGAAHGYYVRVGDAGVPSSSGERREGGRAVCILPRGAKEGVRHEAEGRTFDLVVGRSVRFDLYASDVARDAAGAIVTLDDDAFERLPPVVTHLPATSKEQSVRVRLGGELLTTGQLELACSEIAQAGQVGRRFRLEFALREGARATSMPPASLAPPSIVPPASTEVRASIAPSRLAEAEKILDKVFGKKGEATPREVKDVLRDLEKAIGDRLTWTMETCRLLADRLLSNTGSRRRSPNHERAYWLLLGFCMRPGFGDPGDPKRIERAWPLFEGRLGFPNEAQGWQQFFIAWRRMAGGLTEAMQEAIRDAMDPIVAPKEAGLKPPKRVPEDGGEALVMLAALERAPAARRAVLGEWIVDKTWTNDDARLWTAIGRVGARVPVYASVHHVVPVRNAEAWIERLLRLKWENVATAQHAAVQLARVTGDRARDVNERLRKEIEKRLAAMNAKETWVRAVRELAEVGEEERVAIMGEGLPIGLKLAD